MNKLFTKITALALGAAMVVGVGVSVGSSPKVAETKAADVTDTLNRTTTGQTGTSYGNWSGKTGDSGAVYAGNSAGGNSSIQLRSNNNNSGIVATTSGGKVKSVKLTWNSNTDAARKVSIYGKNSAYSAASDLYGNSSGDKLGELQYSSTANTLTVTGDYTFVGIRSSSGALYLSKVEITWSSGSTPVSRTVTYKADGFSASDVVRTGTSLTVENNMFTLPTGSTFRGWFTGTGGTGTQYTVGASVNSDLTLYAYWGYLMTYKANGGTGSDVTEYTSENSAYSVKTNSFSKSGNSFVKWNTEANGSGTDYLENQSITPSSPLTLYAQWGPRENLGGIVNGEKYFLIVGGHV